MTRAKHRAGIPVTEPSKPATKKPVRKSYAFAPHKKPAESNKEYEKRADLQSRLGSLNFRKPASKFTPTTSIIIGY
jgi:hypothetical protein